MNSLAKIFKALADETRLRIMALILDQGELCVCDCMYILEISQSKASRHLRYLANAGLLTNRRATVWVYYNIPEGLDQDHRNIIDSLKGWLTPERESKMVKRVAKWKQVKKNGRLTCSEGINNAE